MKIPPTGKRNENLVLVQVEGSTPPSNMTSLRVALPNELWNFILSDVIGTYVHSFILLPSSCPCWPAYYVLRSVSKRVKALVDDIWISVIGPGDTGQDDLLKIRYALLDMQEDPFPEMPSTPLIAAYSCYVIALYKQQIPRYQIEDLEHVTDDKPLTAQSSHGKWLKTGLALTYKVRPREAGYLLQADLEAAVNLYISDIKISTAHRLITGTLGMVAYIGDLSGQDLEHLFKLVYHLARASVSADADFMEYKHTVDFEAARRSLAVQQSPVELSSQDKKSDDILRQKIDSCIVILNATWLERIAKRESRKREVHRVATYGIRRHSPTDS